MNNWKLTDEQRESFVPVIEAFIVLDNKVDDFIELDFTNQGLSPWQLVHLLEEIGYERGETETNGWEMDFWIFFSKEGCKTIVIAGIGMTFELKLTTNEDE